MDNFTNPGCQFIPFDGDGVFQVWWDPVENDPKTIRVRLKWVPKAPQPWVLTLKVGRKGVKDTLVKNLDDMLGFPDMPSVVKGDQERVRRAILELEEEQKA